MGNSLGTLFIDLELKNKISEGLNTAKSQISGFGSTLDATGKKVSGFGRTATAGITAPLVGIGAAFAGCLSQQAAFEKGMNEVFTLLPGASAEMKNKLSDDITALSNEMGRPTEELIPAMYAALSAGIPADNVIDFLRTSTKTAIGGCATTEEAVDALTTAYNNYGGNIEDVTGYSDILFVTMQKGKTTIGETAHELADMVPIAESMGIPLEEVGAGFALITAKGIQSAEAATYTRSMYKEWGDETNSLNKIIKESAGTTIPEFMAAGHDSAEVLQLLQDVSNKTGIPVQQLFGSIEAGQAALMLTSGYDVYNSNLEAMRDSSGATETAYAEMNQGLTDTTNDLTTVLKNASKDIGKSLGPVLQNDIIPLVRDDLVPLLTGVVIPGIQKAAEVFSSLPGPVRKAALGAVILVGALGPIAMVAGSIISGVGAMAGAFSAVTGALGIGAGAGLIGGLSGTAAVLGPLVPPIMAVVAAAGLAYYAFKNWDTITGYVGEAWDFIKEEFTLGALFPPVAVAQMMNAITKEITGVDMFESGRDLLESFGRGIREAASGVYDDAKATLEKINNLFPHSPAKEGPFSKLPNWSAIFEGIEDVDTAGMAGRAITPMASNLQPLTGGIGGGNTTNTYGGDTFEIKIGTVNNQQDIDYLMQEIDRRNKSRRIQRGINL